MQAVYTHQNIVIVGAAKNILENAGIPCHIKNEFSNTMGAELGVMNVWAELWVDEAKDFERAKSVLDKELNTDGPDWICETCAEKNGANFGFCWQCGTRASASSAE